MKLVFHQHTYCSNLCGCVHSTCAMTIFGRLLHRRIMVIVNCNKRWSFFQYWYESLGSGLTYRCGRSHAHMETQ